MNPFLAPGRFPWRRLPAALAVLVVVVGVTVAVRQSSPGRAAPAAARSAPPSVATSPAPRAGALPSATAVPGLDATAEEKLLGRCLRKEQREDAPDARVYNVLTVGKATLALIFATDWKIGCYLDQPRRQGVGDVSLDIGMHGEWMTGPIAIDARNSSNAVAGEPGWDVIGGRVASNVARVTVELRGNTVDVPAVNHTYLVHFRRARDYPETGRENEPMFVVRAFDADGEEIASFDGTGQPDCTFDGNGERLEWAENPPVKPCVTASPWA